MEDTPGTVALLRSADADRVGRGEWIKSRMLASGNFFAMVNV